MHHQEISSNNQPTVLVVDDIVSNQNLLRETLEPRGYEVLIAAEGEVALEVAAAAQPNLILLDVNMPGLDGFETCRRLKAAQQTRHIPVIFITAYHDTESVTRGFRVGAVDFVSKPFQQEEVLARVATHQRIHQLNRSLAEKNDALQAALVETVKAKELSDELLHVIMPHDVVEELKRTQRVRPRRLEPVGVLFCDIAEFTTFCDQHDVEEVHERLQTLVEAFEQITHEHGLEKIKTIGDAFMAIARPTDPTADPTLATVQCGLALIQAAQEQAPQWKLRVGVHTGSVIAGVVGHKKYQFDVWGDTVNVAARLQQAAPPGSLCANESLWPALAPHFHNPNRDRQHIKGKGEVDLIFLQPDNARQ